MVWAMENPRAGIIDPDDVDFQRVLEIANPYLGKVVGVYTDWTPLDGTRTIPFPKMSMPRTRGSSRTFAWSKREELNR